MPPCLGGSGDYDLSFKDHPYAVRKEGFKEYLLVTMGFHVAGFFVHFMESKKNDFVEMGLHHIVTLFLFGGMYLLNVWETGAVIAFLHDIADIFVGLTKVFSETKLDNCSVVCFAGLLSAWFYTRILLLPYLIQRLYVSGMDLGNMGLFSFCYLISCMYLLHCYWFSIFLKILKKYTSTGATDDMQERVETETVKEDSSKKSK